VLYCNDGDWVESLTALVEHHDGRLEIIDRSASLALAHQPPALPLPAPAAATQPALLAKAEAVLPKSRA
jgi:hypothetical protein